MPRLFRAFEFLTFIAAIWVISMGVIGLYLKAFNMAPPLPALAVNVPVFLAMIIVMVVRFRELSLGSMSALPYVLIALLGIASYRWSLMPSFTLREALVAAIYVAYIATMAWRYSWRDLINGMWIAMFSMVMVSFVLYFGVPSIGRMSEIHTGTMSGLWLEKNTAGQIGVFGAGLALARFAISPKTAITSIGSFFVFTLFLLLTTSKTSLVAFIVGCIAFVWVFFMRRNRPVFWITTWTTIFGGIFAFTWVKSNTAVLLAMLGRNATFTGRSEIWKAVEMSLADRPLLGHGFSAYWDENYLGKTITYVYDDLQYMPRHSHNSFIEMKLGLGEVGAFLLVFAVIFYFLVTLTKIRRSHGAYFAIPFTLSAVIIGSFESVLAMPANFAGCMIILVAAKMVRPELWEEKGSTLVKVFNRFRSLAEAQRPVPAHPGMSIGFADRRRTTYPSFPAVQPRFTPPQLAPSAGARFVHTFGNPTPGGTRPNPTVS